jgi:hypothetical protein
MNLGPRDGRLIVNPYAFLRGLGRIFYISPYRSVRFRASISSGQYNWNQSDREALSADWRAVGSDIRAAIHRYQDELIDAN